MTVLTAAFCVKLAYVVLSLIAIFLIAYFGFSGERFKPPGRATPDPRKRTEMLEGESPMSRALRQTVKDKQAEVDTAEAAAKLAGIEAEQKESEAKDAGKKGNPEKKAAAESARVKADTAQEILKKKRSEAKGARGTVDSLQEKAQGPAGGEA